MAVSTTQLGSSSLFFFFFLTLAGAQQDYLRNRQLNCSNTDPITFGFAYNASAADTSTCRSYLTFRSRDPYTSLATIAYLLNTTAPAMVSLNNFTDIESIPAETPIIAPANCSSSGQVYQHNASYAIKTKGETYFNVANDTYQGLSTCQALEAQNPYPATGLNQSLSLLVPLRCACPTSAQATTGILYLLTYLIIPGDTIESIADMFGVSQQSVLDANNLVVSSVIYPYNPILVPLTTEPKIVLSATPPSSSPPPASPPPPSGGSSSSKKWVFVGVGIGAAVIVVLGAVAFWLHRRRKQEEKPLPVLAPPPKKVSDSDTDYKALPTDSSSWSVSGIRDAIESLTIYRYEDLQKATGSFAEENRIRGSVYRGKFKGDDAAVKVVKGDVSSEINILKLINHSNIVRLSGFCLHEGNSYLVYEYAENGSLSDWLHCTKEDLRSTLSWKQRTQIAHNVADAINYLHNYANPPYIHKNLKSSNVLLDGNFRAKVSNFGLARSVEAEDGGLQLTRHVVGTQGYMSPEYIENGVITPKLDVFAFGVVMLELLSGKEAVGKSKDREELLSSAINRVLEGDNVREKLHGFMDPSLGNEYPLDLAYSMAELARNCVAYDMNRRPAMPEVLMTLSKIYSSSLDWDPSDDLSNSRSMSHGR